MILPDFDLKIARWDAWHAFHIGGEDKEPFVHFDTGELICTWAARHSDNRKLYKRLNLRLVATTDDECPHLKTEKGEPLKKAWLTHKGLQVLLIDEDSGRAVQIDTDLDKHPYVPARFERRRITAYFGGPGMNAIGSPIDVRRPYSPPAEERKHIEELLATCKAWTALNPQEVSPAKHFWERKVVNYTTMVRTTFDDAPASLRIQIARYGYRPCDRPAQKFDYLLVV